MSHNWKFNWRYYNVPFEKATNCQKFVSLKFAIISPNCHSFGEIFMNFTIVFYYVYNPSEICSAFPNFLTILHQIAQLNLYYMKHFWQMFAKFSLTFLVEVFVRSFPLSRNDKKSERRIPRFFFVRDFWIDIFMQNHIRRRKSLSLHNFLDAISFPILSCRPSFCMHF